jgi:hypothetical protein
MYAPGSPPPPRDRHQQNQERKQESEWEGRGIGRQDGGLRGVVVGGRGDVMEPSEGEGSD